MTVSKCTAGYSVSKLEGPFKGDFETKKVARQNNSGVSSSIQHEQGAENGRNTQ